VIVSFRWIPYFIREEMVGPARFELTTSCTPCKRSTRLNYGPTFSAPGGAWAVIMDGEAGECN